MDKSQPKPQKKAYASPQLTVYGTVKDLTLHRGFTNKDNGHGHFTGTH